MDQRSRVFLNLLIFCSPERQTVHPVLHQGSFQEMGALDQRHRVSLWRRWFSPSVVSNSCDPMGDIPPGFSAHRVSQARTLERVSIPQWIFPTRGSNSRLLNWQEASASTGSGEKPPRFIIPRHHGTRKWLVGVFLCVAPFPLFLRALVARKWAASTCPTHKECGWTFTLHPADTLAGEISGPSRQPSGIRTRTPERWPRRRRSRQTDAANCSQSRMQGRCFPSLGWAAGWQAIIKIFLVAQRIKCLPAMWKTRVQSLGWEDPLEKGMATHSRTLAWEIPWIKKPSRLESTGSQRAGHDWVTSLSL